MDEKEVLIPAEGGVRLGARLFLPESPGPRPAITMGVGFGGIKEQGLLQFAEKFSEAGFVVLVHDHRNFGASEGEPRGDINPWQQVADWRRVISYLESLPEVDENRIGLWGSSWAGGHAFVLGATDRRIKAVVAQVPVTDGIENARRRVPPTALAQLEREFDEDERGQFQGKPPVSRAMVSDDPNVPAFYRDPAAVSYYLRPLERDVKFDNLGTLRSMRWTRMYAPGQWAAAVSPTPLLFIVGKHDTTSGTDLQFRTYEQALQPKGLTILEGDHFAPYLEEFDKASGAALEWFQTHL